jgi:hypothetical protein
MYGYAESRGAQTFGTVARRKVVMAFFLSEQLEIKLIGSVSVITPCKTACVIPRLWYDLLQ